MELYFLGTNAGVPTLQRNVTSIALRLLEERRSLWLFDCGEGTQHQILKSPLKLSKLEKVFITHMHGDHIFGLPGLLSSRGAQGVTLPLAIYGPPGIKSFIETTLNISQSRVPYTMEIMEHTGGVLFEDDSFRVEAAKLDHRAESYGYRIEEKDLPGSLDLKRLEAYGLKPGPLYGKLKRGESVDLGGGRWIHASDVLLTPKKGRVVTILGDTRPCPGVESLSKGADLLVHEATFMDDLTELAHEYYHSTAKQAAEAAERAGVKTLFLTHFSSRYKDIEHLQPLLKEAQQIFEDTRLAEDFGLYPIQRRS
ncbi:ribonuclease Z [Paenibacillus glucanolyticus]|jgi:ribonuclease Z|uniref:ribonuclease Z n=1 Tax=Paenibacillus TaxID=44249 RepID=UPI0003E28F1A|nr:MULTISPECIES: ribonuclease Z [Paenibacillus]ANA82194.1 ribonuclease Z [Paenibacillus glucanolyticus]AVV59070.1 ribonuclease Z [Paenibacillus glucanolyticus]ETT42684.1 ribonuclease Z [Paenibacillus sp. FSL R5-808]